jgi:Rad3-related DNA helicase
MYPDEQSSAGGRRVIRSEDDTGAVLLIDERFSRKHYADYCRKLAPLQEDQRS